MKKDSYIKRARIVCVHMTEVVMLAVVIYTAVALKMYRDKKEDDKRKAKRNY